MIHRVDKVQAAWIVLDVTAPGPGRGLYELVELQAVHASLSFSFDLPTSGQQQQSEHLKPMRISFKRSSEPVLTDSKHLYTVHDPSSWLDKHPDPLLAPYHANGSRGQEIIDRNLGVQIGTVPPTIVLCDLGDGPGLLSKRADWGGPTGT